MAANPDRIALWPLYFDGKVSRSDGRRVAKAHAVPDPNLEAVAWAAGKAGLRRMKRDAEAAHPSRVWKAEGRLWLSRKEAKQVLGSASKEAVITAVAKELRAGAEEQREQDRREQQGAAKTGTTRRRGAGAGRAAARQQQARRRQQQRRR